MRLAIAAVAVRSSFRQEAVEAPLNVLRWQAVAAVNCLTAEQQTATKKKKKKSRHGATSWFPVAYRGTLVKLQYGAFIFVHIE